MYKLFLILLIGILTPSFAHSLEIIFKPAVTVEGSGITLGDVADFSEQSEYAAALASLYICKAPDPGKTTAFRAIRIKNHLGKTNKLQDSIDTLYWKGSPVIKVSRSGTIIGPNKILSIIDTFLAQNSKAFPNATVQFTPSRLPLPFAVPVGELSYDVIPSDPAIIGSSRFSIIFKVNNTVVKNMSVIGKLAVFADIVVAGKPLVRGQLLTSEDLELKRMEISRTPDSFFSVQDLAGKRLKRNMRAGSVFRESHVEPMPIILQGQKVKMVLQNPSMILTATGLARKDGAAGDIIRVQNIHTSKIIICRVAGPGIVEVIL